MSAARIERVGMHLEPDGLVRVRVECAGTPGSLGWVLTDPSGHDVLAGFAETDQPEFTIEMSGPPGTYELHVGLTVDSEMVDQRSVPFSRPDVLT